MGIGSGKIMGIQAGRLNPLDRGTFQRLRLARRQGAEEEFEVNRLFRVIVDDFFKEGADLDGHSQLFLDFPDQTGLEGFSGFTFAAGKFP